MFGRTWTWLVPLFGAGAVFAFVLVTTPPGFASIISIVLTRGTDPAAYAAGAAASLALLALLLLSALCAAADLLLRRLR